MGEIILAVIRGFKPDDKRVNGLSFPIQEAMALAE